MEEHTIQLATTQSHESDNSLVFVIDSDSCTGPMAPGARAMEKGAERSPESPGEVAVVSTAGRTFLAWWFRSGLFASSLSSYPSRVSF